MEVENTITGLLLQNDGQNLLEPGDRPHENIRFLLFVCAIIEAVDTYPELLRMAASCYGNDYRLGADEAPPAVISICMGDELEIILEKLRNGEHEFKKCSRNTTLCDSELILCTKRYKRPKPYFPICLYRKQI